MLLTLRIQDVRPATPRARIVHLDLEGQPFPYQPGQAVLIGAHGAERRKPYSLCASPEQAQRTGRLELLVGADDSDSSGAHLPALEPGALVDVEGPTGRFTFPDHPDQRRFVFVAGGTGIAPLRAMMQRALTLPERHIGLLYSARTPMEFAYEDELRELARKGEIELRLTVTRDAPEAWSGPRGRIGRENLVALVHDLRTLCFVCGPPALVDEIPALLMDLGIPAGHIRKEEWT